MSVYRVSDVAKKRAPKKGKSGAARFSKVLRPALLRPAVLRLAVIRPAVLRAEAPRCAFTPKQGPSALHIPVQQLQIT